MTLNVQFITMIAMVIGGLYLGIIQETFRRFSVHWKRRRVMAYFMEISFWLSQTMILYYLLFRVNNGELRFYVFVAVLLGFSVYQALVANIYKRLLEQIISIVLKCFRIIEKVINFLIITPVKFIIQVAVTCVMFVLHILLNIVRYVLKVVVAPILWIFRALFGILPENIQNKLYKIAEFYSTIENTCRKWVKKILFKRR
ncbi:spore cortex biosynthesis protein YabQ [Virgibacillus siamensis]|uniref:spore cortex biosynthesis protein YabQ n=1 Tax=Virgibacillus siamensis TaxID=480071 RepID=UPI00098449AC|nr:spore cortex biosynthesis protein YabQ [Virgibacillus siamensis]